MKTVFYRLECLTNLHVGSGENNYQIVDNEVEKDITGIPMIHASGMKGALRQALRGVYSEAEIQIIFGKTGEKNIGNSGSCKFLDAHLLSRPMRVAGSSETPCASVTTIHAVNRFLKQMRDFGVEFADGEAVELPSFGDAMFLSASEESIEVEGEKTGRLTDPVLGRLTALSDLLFTAPFAVAKTFDGYDLPVLARNCVEKGRENLWFEEVVPSGSVFFFAVVYPDGEQELRFPKVLQIGGNSSIGCGLTRISKIAQSAEE